MNAALAFNVASPDATTLHLRGYQRDALEAVHAAHEAGMQRPLVTMATGLGKALPVDEPVLTPGGWATMGSLRVGDEVIGGDGRPVAVTGVFPQGIRPIAEIEFSDGARVRCDLDHLWAIRDKYDVHKRRPWRVVATRDIDMARRWRIPMVMPVEHPHAGLPLDPYLLGILLGDGGLSVPGRVLLHTEHELARSLELPHPCTLTKLRDDGAGGIGGTYRIASPIGRGANPVLSAIRALGLEGAHAGSKRMPAQYMVAPVADRLELLRGIMDADGHVRADKHVEITLANRGLIEDVAALVRSLGGTARVRRKPTTWTHQEERRHGEAWRCSIALGICPFRWKTPRWQPRTKYHPARHIKAIRPSGEAECVCIKVAADDGLFVTRDYVVTHNTVCFSHLAKERGGRTLVIAHREELIKQAAGKLRQVNRDVSVGIVKAARDETDAQIVVASIQTLARATRRERLIRGHRFDTIVIDEAHHAGAPTYVKVIEAFGGFTSGGPLVVGFTATPDPKNRRLNAVWQKVIYEYDIIAGIENGYLCDLAALRAKLSVNLNDVRVKQGDYEAGQLGEVLEAAKAPSLAVKSYLKHAVGRSALCFTPTVHMAHVVAETFKSAGVTAEALDGTTPEEERRGILGRLNSGETCVVANCAVLTEGFDEPRVDCIIIARPTRSQILYRQMIGRGTRLFPGKDDCLVIDMVGASATHSLVQLGDAIGIPGDLSKGVRARRSEQQAVEREKVKAARLYGEVEAEEVSLSQRFSWVKAGRGFALSMGADGFVVIWPARDDTWAVGHIISKTNRRRIMDGLDFGYAQGMAEDHARRAGALSPLNNRGAAWRQKPPSVKQARFARRMGIDSGELTAGQLSIEIDRVRILRMLDQVAA